ncbi:N-acetylmuramoyl-L-alanine amidase [soil metagenome]
MQFLTCGIVSFLLVFAGTFCMLSSVFACPVAVDVGHYLKKPGATSARGVVEFEFNRALASRIKQSLELQKCAVIAVGFQGEMSDLKARTAQAAKADFFLSVHHDSVQSHFLQPWNFNGVKRLYSDRFAGFSLFVSRENPDLTRSIHCASAIGAALRAQGFTPSLYHADPGVGEARPFVDKENGVHYFDGLVVLKTASQAAVLFEAGVIVNREEELRLASAPLQQKMATAVTSALGLCLADDLSSP